MSVNTGKELNMKGITITFLFLLISSCTVTIEVPVTIMSKQKYSNKKECAYGVTQKTYEVDTELWAPCDMWDIGDTLK